MSNVFSRSRQIVRSLVRRPGFALPAVLTLAIGIGATTAVFSVLYTTLLRPLPYADAARLVRVWGSDLHNDERRAGVSLPDFRDWAAQSSSFAATSAFQSIDATLTEPRAAADRIPAALVTAGFFDTLGVAPLVGRPFAPSDDRPGSEPVAILAHDLWITRFGGDRSALGRTISIDGTLYTITGIMPAEVAFPRRTQVWIPLEPNTKAFMRDRGIRALGVVARLKDGVTPATAQRDMDIITARLARAFPDQNKDRGAFVEPLRDALVGPAGRLVTILFGAVLLLLLLCCANVAALLVVRTGQREREMGIRLALGASRMAIVGELVVESIFVGAAGAAAGVFLAWVGVRALVRVAPESLPMRDAIAVNGTVILFGCVLALLTSIAASLLPALRGTAATLQSVVRPAQRTGGHSVSRPTRAMLVVAELALGVMLTAGALLILRSYANLAAVDPGVGRLDSITAEVKLPDSKSAVASPDDDPARLTHLYDELTAGAGRLPELRSFALAMNHPLREGWTTGGVSIPGAPPPQGAPDQFYIRAITSHYSETVGLALLAGRDIAQTDRADGALVVAVNQALVDRHFHGTNPVGRSIVLWGKPRTIVGVFANEKFRGLQEGTAPALYPPLYQVPSNEVDLVARSTLPLSATITDLRQVATSVDRDIAVTHPAVLRDLLAESLAPERFTAVLLTVFGAIALVLAALGVFGLIAFQVNLRLHELGIRAALGAGRHDLVLMIVREAAALSVAAVCIGWLGAFSVTRFLGRFLFGVTPLDPVTFAASGAVLVLVGVAAALIPAIRASRIDPMLVLRAD